VRAAQDGVRSAADGATRMAPTHSMGEPIALACEPTASLEASASVPKSPAHPLPNLPVSFTTRAASARTPFTL
jgi:hypothetical protein